MVVGVGAGGVVVVVVEVQVAENVDVEVDDGDRIVVKVEFAKEELTRSVASMVREHRPLCQLRRMYC